MLLGSKSALDKADIFYVLQPFECIKVKFTPSELVEEEPNIVVKKNSNISVNARSTNMYSI